jgi:hypothetical protein
VSRFVVSKVSTAAINREGTELMICVTDGAGDDLDIVTSATGLEDILNALNEAAAKAFARRRESGIVEPATDPGNGELLNCLGFRFAIAEDRSHMRLQLQTTVGRFDILVPAVHADAFRDATMQNVALLFSPPRKTTH